MESLETGKQIIFQSSSSGVAEGESILQLIYKRKIGNFIENTLCRRSLLMTERREVGEKKKMENTLSDLIFPLTGREMDFSVLIDQRRGR